MTPVSMTETETQRFLGELQETNRALHKIIQDIDYKSSQRRLKYVSVYNFFRRYRNFILALPNLSATFLWLLMLIYFIIWFLRLPRDAEGHFPRICDQFSLWPYISCIGAKRLSLFRGVCTTMAILIPTSFVLLCYLSNDIQPGHWLRRAAAVSAMISSFALCALSFESVSYAPRTHLIFTSIQIFCMGNTKFFDWTCNSAMRRWFGKQTGRMYRIRPLEVSRWLKSCVAAFAAVPAMITCMGIYSCTDTEDILNPTSNCNKVVALSAVAEWLLSVGWVAYLSTVAYDLYHIELIVQLFRSAGSYSASSDEDGIGAKTHDGTDPTTPLSGSPWQLLLPQYTLYNGKIAVAAPS